MKIEQCNRNPYFLSDFAYDDEIHFCQEHKMDMEVAALQYKYKAFK